MSAAWHSALTARRRVFPSEKFPGFFDGTRKQANGHYERRMINSREIDYVTGANIGDERGGGLHALKPHVARISDCVVCSNIILAAWRLLYAEILRTLSRVVDQQEDYHVIEFNQLQLGCILVEFYFHKNVFK